MKEHLLQVAAIGFMVLFVSAVSAGPEDSEHRGMHRSHGGMMHGGPDIERMAKHISRRLELDDTQALVIRNIVDAAKPEAMALRQQVRSNRKAMHKLDVADADYDLKLQNFASRNGELVTQMTLLHGRIMAEVNAELTDEQRAKLSAELDGKRKKSRHHRRSREPAEESSI